MGSVNDEDDNDDDDDDDDDTARAGGRVAATERTQTMMKNKCWRWTKVIVDDGMRELDNMNIMAPASRLILAVIVAACPSSSSSRAVTGSWSHSLSMLL